MGNTHSQNSDYEVWTLKSEFADSLRLKQEPDGWDEEDYEIKRHKTYHGIFVSFANSLVFRKDAIDYIDLAYQIGGINANLYLTRHKLKEVNGDIKYVQDYFGLADYSTMVKKDNGLEINFNSNQLEELIKSHESDTFEIERINEDGYATSIDDKLIPNLELFKTQIKGRTIAGIGESNVDLEINTEDFSGKKYQKVPVRTLGTGTAGLSNPITRIITEGPERFINSTTNRAEFQLNSGNMFFDRQILEGTTVDLDISFDIKGVFNAGLGQSGIVNARIGIYEWDGDATWTEISYETIKTWSWDSDSAYRFEFDFSGTHRIENLQYNQGVAISYYVQNPGNGSFPFGNMFFEKHRIRVNSSDFYEASPDLTFSFFHDVINRLMTIITGDTDRFYSNYFGRTELGYTRDGYGGLIGVISGFWARAFDPFSEKYKSLQISLKDALESAQAVFNVGIGVETKDFKQRLRVEELEYFYQNTVVVRLPYQANSIVRKVDKDLFFSGTEFGYQHGGEYESEVGLDEPNTRTNSVTPIRKSNLKYRKVSKIRSDDTGLELIRRKPQSEFGDEDTSQDEHNWFLDLKRAFGIGYEQRDWSDRLESVPKGVSSPENYRAMIFTPLRMMLRHGFVLRSGLEPYLTKLIKYASSAANSKLTTHTIGEESEYKENQDILVGDLDRSRFLPEIVSLKHPVNDELMDLILGSTEIFYNGKYETIPNVYFKFEWINEFQEIESGYLLSLKPKGDGEFEFQKANENII